MTKPDMDAKANLADEAEAFDSQILERVAHGHVPDLRYSERCEWFQNNLWRDPFYVELTFGRIVKALLEAVKVHAPSPARILEVGCGPGHVALELARAGHVVEALDISPACIDVAEKTARRREEDKNLNLTYHCVSLEMFEPISAFDVVVFVGSLHHFSDPNKTLEKVHSLIAPGGLLFVSEPIRRNFGLADAAVIHMLRVLLSQAGLYFEEHSVPVSPKTFGQALDVIKRQVCYTDEKLHKTQSPNDNDCTFEDIMEAVSTRFEVLLVAHDYAFIDCILGGIRGANREQETRLASWLAWLDECLVQGGQVRPRQGHLLAAKREPGGAVGMHARTERMTHLRKAL